MLTSNTAEIQHMDFSGLYQIQKQNDNMEAIFTLDYSATITEPSS